MREENTIIYQDEMIRKKTVDGQVQEDLLAVQVKWYSPHPSVGVFEIEDATVMNIPYISGNKKIKKL